MHIATGEAFNDGLERLGLLVAVQRRQPLLRLDDRLGASPEGAQRRKGEPVHTAAPSRAGGLREADDEPLGGNARGGTDQAAETSEEACADPPLMLPWDTRAHEHAPLQLREVSRLLLHVSANAGHRG